MSGDGRFRYEIQRQDIVGLEPDPSALLDRGLAEIEAAVLRGDAVPPRVRWYLADAIETGKVPDEGEPERVLSMLFLAWAAREGVVLAIRQSGILEGSEFPDGLPRIGVLSIRPPPDGREQLRRGEGLDSLPWAMALGPVGPGEDGRPRILRWDRSEGVGSAALPGFARQWLEADGLRFARVELQEAGAAGELDIRLSVGELAAPVPADVRELLLGVAEIVDPEVQDRGLDGLLIFAIDQATLQRWEIRGALPCSLDDLVRNVAGTGPVLGLVVVQVGVVNVDGQKLRALVSHGELGANRGLRWVPMAEEGAGFSGEPGRILTMDLPSDSGWIGVPPGVELGLSPTGTLWSAGAVAEA